MAINPLYGYDTGQYGYAQANQTPQLIGRQYPAWMTDPNARGIGVAQSSAYAPPPPIAIPQGDGTGGFNQAPALLPPAPQNGQEAAGAGYPAPSYGAEGAGAVGDISSNVSDQPAPGILADILGGLGLSTGAYGGPAGDGSTGASSEAASASGGSPDSAAAGFGGGYGGIDGFGGLYRGGVVTPNRLRGPNPPGPDDGYAALNVGEGVLTAAAMKHYGPAFLRKLNKLQVPKGR